MAQDFTQIQEQISEEDKETKLLKSLSGIKNTIMVMSGKGGVGKSTVSANLAVGLAHKGYRVGVLDGDIHGPDMPKVLGVEDGKLMADENGNILPVKVLENLKLVSVGYLIDSQDTPVIWRGPMKHSVMKQFLRDVNWGELDFLVVDLPPGTGDEPLSIAQIIKNAQGAVPPSAVVVTTPQDVALLDSRKSVQFARALELKILGIVENMSGFACPHCGETIDLFKIGGGRKAAEDLGVPFLGSIPIDPKIVTGTDEGKPFIAYDNGSGSVKAFKQILDTIIENS
ncbi:MAG: Mrp/NBP35 family ATP-binding protein [Deltaproteobacteria bacterium]|nr:Mrp/NBP35 family ATP-binding protein [Deltaproteobacteria bacterium]